MLIEDLVPNIESEDVEFKGLLDQGRDSKGRSREIGWLKTLAAFANTRGGTLYAGVDNKSHAVLALNHTEADKTALLVQQQIRERIDPNLEYSIEALCVPETKPIRYVLAIHVTQSPGDLTL